MNAGASYNGHLDLRRVFEFVELPGFSSDWESLGYSDDDLRKLQNRIMSNPLVSPVIRGTGGLRKLRFAPLKSALGKRGGTRICYALFLARQIVLLVMAYPKNKKDDLTPKEKRVIKQILERCARDFAGL